LGQSNKKDRGKTAGQFPINFDKVQETPFTRAIMEGLWDVEENRTFSLTEAKEKFCLK
jgi:hypothetical protein